MKKVIIVGTPRGGTQRVHSAFGHAKIDSAWESDADLTISFFMGVDGDDYARKHIPYWDRHVDEIWHQTRDPLYCIPAMADVTPASVWVWQHQYTGLHPTAFRSRMEFCAHFWVRWHEECEARKPIWQYRVEDFDKVWPEMWKRLDIGEAPPINERSDVYDNQRREPITYDEIRSWGPSIHDSVRRLADRYGYEENA